MRRCCYVLVLAAMVVGGCTWPKWGRKAEPPVSMPATAAPTTQPAEAATEPAFPAVAAVPVPAPGSVAPAPAPVPVGPVPAVPAPTPAAPAPAPVPAVPAPSPPTLAPAPAPRPANASVMAYVNGRAIPMDDLTALLVAGHGLPVAQQLVANELVNQEAARQGIAVTDADAKAEHDSTLHSMFGDVKDPDQLHRLLGQLLERNRVSREQWDLTMRRNAVLAKLAERQVKIADEELQEEFGRQYDRKVEVLHIQTASLADAQKVLRELAGGAEFAALVARYSTGASARNGGLMAPFGAKTLGVPPAIRAAAMAMTRVGEVSDPIQVGTAFHVIKLLRLIAPQHVKFEDVKDKLAAELRSQHVRLLQQEILQDLIRRADIQFVHPILKAQSEEKSAP